MRLLKYIVATLLVLPVVSLGGMLALGTRGQPPEMVSISNPFKSVDFSDLPTPQSLAAANASPIMYRRYGPNDASDVIVAIHGSSAASSSLHPLAKSLASAGFAVYIPDMRGHGATGQRGDVDYLGQPHDDLRALVALVRAAHQEARLTLVGFSLGGGFALRTAGGVNGPLFDRYVLLAPTLGPGAPTARVSEDTWARPHVPRIIALSILNRFRIRAFNSLEVIAFAVPPGSEKIQTSRYSYRLLFSLLPTNYAADLKAATRPIKILVGDMDELYDSAKFSVAVHPHRSDVSITIIPAVDHIGLTIAQPALAALIAELK